jgi:hypothetical protein
MDDEFEGTLKENVMAYSTPLSPDLNGGSEERHGRFHQDSKALLQEKTTL